MSIYDEYVRLIAETDKMLARQHKTLLDAKTPDARVQSKNDIDELLDLRIQQMRRRDAAKGASS